MKGPIDYRNIGMLQQEVLPALYFVGFKILDAVRVLSGDRGRGLTCGFWIVVRRIASGNELSRSKHDVTVDFFWGSFPSTGPSAW